MIAWVSPARTVRLTPRRISFGPSSVVTEACRSLISKVDMCSQNSVVCGGCPGLDARHGQFGLDRRLEPLAQLGQRDAAQDLAEEAAYDQAPRDVLGDAPA